MTDTVRLNLQFNGKTLVFDRLYTHVNIATMTKDGPAYGAVKDGVIGVTDGRLAFVGRMADLPQNHSASEIINKHGQWVFPGFIDCHTHLVYGGNRAAEFEMRLKGSSYKEIAENGGGIISTVKATRTASEDELATAAAKRLCHMASGGVTTAEIKSGYGLTLNDELKMLRAAKKAGQMCDISVTTTLLAAHAVPPEFAGRADDYVTHICCDIIPETISQGCATAVDAFCETIAFTPKQISRVFDAAKKHGLAIKLHADQLSDLGGGGLAAKYGALSADHLEYASEASVQAMAKSGTVAVLLPGAFYVLGETQKPPVDLMRKHGVDMALATDSNPGSSPVSSIQLMLHMGCTLFDLTPEEALAGITRNAAKALGLGDRGTLEVGKRADMVFFDIEQPAELAYWVGGVVPSDIVRAPSSLTQS